jgi:acyl-CoA synthetase (AMP-forming)/AMP-acid ligase II
LGALLSLQAERAPDRPFLRSAGTSCSFAQAELAARAFAATLAAYGVDHRDRVAVMLPNGITYPVVWFAIAKAGAVIVPLNIQYRERDLEHTLRDSGAALVVTTPDLVEHVAAVRGRCPAIRDILIADQHMNGGEAPRVTRNVGLNDLLNIQYTSGTTGLPKGCMLTHEYWLRMGELAVRFSHLTSDDVAIIAQPFSYVDPLWHTVMCLTAGATLVILPRFSASTFWHSVREHSVTFFYMIGTMPVYLMKQPVDPALERGHRVRLASCSGIPPQVHASLEERYGMPWRECYAQTETGWDLQVEIEDDWSVGTGAVGHPVPGKECRVVDPSGNDVPQGEVGELIVRGKPMMLGYWNHPTATAAKIRDGWSYSGDLVRCDSRGYYYIVGRIKDMVRRSGENVAAAEVEAVLAEHPGIACAAVVPVPDELRGEEVKAFVQLQPGETASTVPPSDIISFVRRRLASFKCPRYIAYIDRLPLTPSQKVAKHALLMDPDMGRGLTFDAVTDEWR